jgi:FMN reductase
VPLIVIVAGSPAPASRTSQLARVVGAMLAGRGFDVEAIDVRDLPPDDLLHLRAASSPLQTAIGLVTRANGVVVVTPVYKASYTGLLKTFLDLLPQAGFGDKVVLPIGVGGTLAHVLAIDYALRPVLLALGAQHVVGGLFLLETLLERGLDGALAIDIQAQTRLDRAVADFVLSLRRHGQPLQP